MSLASRIERIISKGQLVPLSFMQVDVAASQADVQLKVAEVNGATDEDAHDETEYVMPFAGEIVGITASYTADITAGTLDAFPTINGTADALTVQLADTVQRARATQRRQTKTFKAGDRIGAEIDTAASFAPVTSDLLVTVWVLLHLEDV